MLNQSTSNQYSMLISWRGNTLLISYMTSLFSEMTSLCADWRRWRRHYTATRHPSPPVSYSR